MWALRYIYKDAEMRMWENKTASLGRCPISCSLLEISPSLCLQKVTLWNESCVQPWTAELSCESLTLVTEQDCQVCVPTGGWPVPVKSCSSSSTPHPRQGQPCLQDQSVSVTVPQVPCFRDFFSFITNVPNNLPDSAGRR